MECNDNEVETTGSIVLRSSHGVGGLRFFGINQHAVTNGFPNSNSQRDRYPGRDGDRVAIIHGKRNPVGYSSYWSYPYHLGAMDQR